MTWTLKGIALMSLLLTACVTTSTRWERPGASDSDSAWNASDCSAIAWTEAERLHPYAPDASSSVATVDSDWMRRRQQVDNERFGDASRFFDMCMQSRGYAKVVTDRR